MPQSGAVIVQDSSWERYAKSNPRAQALRNVGAQLGRAPWATLHTKAAAQAGVPAQAAVGAATDPWNTVAAGEEPILEQRART